jgi:glutathionyl-hydroquinone reductase
VYKSGFATSAPAYREAVVRVFESLDRVEGMLANKNYLVGDRLTEADIRLYVTIVSTFSPMM